MKEQFMPRVMKQIKARLLNRIRSFIVRTVIDDYNSNGQTRVTIKNGEEHPSSTH
jgi:hypothetical protein